MDSDDEDVAADELQPRTSLRPTPAPFYNAPFKSSVPEVSLMFNNASPEAAMANRPRPLSPHLKNNSKPPERRASQEFESYNAWKYKNLKGSQLNKNGTVPGDDPTAKFKHYVMSPNYSTNNRIGLSDRNELGSSMQTPWAPSEQTYNQHIHRDVPSNNDYYPRMAPLQPSGYRIANSSSLPNETRDYPNESPILNHVPMSPPRNYQLNSMPISGQPPYGQLRTSNGFESGEPLPTRFDPQNININPSRGNYNSSDFQLPNQRFEPNFRNIPPNQNNPTGNEYHQLDPNSWSTPHPRQYLDHIANTVPVSGQVNLSPHDVYRHANHTTPTLDSHYTSLATSYDRNRSGQSNQSAVRDHGMATNHNNVSRDIGLRNSSKRSTASAVNDLCRVVQLQNEQLQILQAQVAQLLTRQLKQDHYNAIEYPREARRNVNPRQEEQGFSSNSRNTSKPSDNNRGLSGTNNVVTKVQNSNLNERQERAENGAQTPSESFAWDKSMNFSVVDETSAHHGDMNNPNNYGSIVQKVSIGVMTSFMDPNYFNNAAALQKNETRRQTVNRPNELLKQATRQLGARPKTHNNQECQSNERENQQPSGEQRSNENETQQKEALPSSLNDFRGNETRLNELVGLETQPKEVWTPPIVTESLSKEVNRDAQNNECQNLPTSNVAKDLPQPSSASGGGHRGPPAPLSNSRVRQWAEQAAASPFDNTRSTPGSAYVNESITLNGLDFPGPVAEHVPSPASSVHVDIQDYRSSDDDRDEDSPTPFRTCGDDRATDSPVEEGERIGWTFYNNVVGQVNEILQSHPSRRRYSDSDTSDDRQPTQRSKQHNAHRRAQHQQRSNNAGAGGEHWSAQRNYDNELLPGNVEAVRNATLEQLRALGVSSYDPELANNGATKKVTFDSVYYNCPRLDFLRMSHEAKESTDISVRMNALAMKYLKEDQINEYVRLSTGHNGHDVAVYNVATKKTNHSFATMRYLERYHLVPAAPRDQRRDLPVNNVAHQVRVPIGHEPTPCRPAEGINNPAWSNPYQYNQPKAPNKILDITALKQQPKFI